MLDLAALGFDIEPEDSAAETTVAGIHFVQEDSPDEIGRTVAGWMEALG
jgi:hypothetical protein